MCSWQAAKSNARQRKLNTISYQECVFWNVISRGEGGGTFKAGSLHVRLVSAASRNSCAIPDLSTGHRVAKGVAS
eukprot:3585601-Rhodomonas_salina.1